MATKIRLALQGGGAKLVSCIAAMRAVERLSKPHAVEGVEHPALIEVTQIAGTSAGSIAAVLFAAGVPMQTVITYFETLKPEDVFPKQPRVPLLTAVRGNPIIDGEQLLRQHLINLLAQGARVGRREAPPQTFAELEIPDTLVVVSDLQSRKALKRTGNDGIVPSVIDSCSLPFILKNRKSANNAMLVDGGLCANLPAEMTATDDKIETLCFSFVPDPPETSRTTLKYGLALLSTAIDSHVARIKTDRKECVHEIQTSVTTLDFRKAVGEALKALRLELAGIEKAAEEFIRRAVARIRAEEAKHVGRIAALTEDPWMAALEGTDFMAKHLTWSMRDHYRLHTINCGSSKVRYLKSHLHVVGHSLRALDGLAPGKKASFDNVNTETTYEVADGNLVSHAVAMGLAAANLQRTTPEIQIFRNGRYEDVDPRTVFNVAALSEDPDEPYKRFMLICFRQPLPKGTRFKLTIKDEVEGMMAKLLKRQDDELYIHPTRKSTDPPELVEITLAAPKLNGSRVTMEPHAEAQAEAPGRAMTHEEILECQRLAPNGYRCQGWRWQGVSVTDRYIVGLTLSKT